MGWAHLWVGTLAQVTSESGGRRSAGALGSGGTSWHLSLGQLLADQKRGPWQ